MVNVPYGGKIRNTVTWNAMVSGAGTKNFELVTFFYKKTGEPAFFSEGKVINSGTMTNIITTLDFNTLNLLDDPSIYQTYDAITFVGDADEPDFPYGKGIYAQKFDADVLTIVPAYGAQIVSTVFVKV